MFVYFYLYKIKKQFGVLVQFFLISDIVTATSAAKFAKLLSKAKFCPQGVINVISVKVIKNFNLLFISVYIENTNEVPSKHSGFSILKSHEFRKKCLSTGGSTGTSSKLNIYCFRL